MAKEADIYSAADKAVKAMDRENVEAFGRLKMTKWDEVKIIRTVWSVYRASKKRARKRYYEIGFEAYLLAMAMCGEEPKKAHQMAEKAITEEWVDEILSQTDFVTLYRFDTETERKAYRLAETLEVAQDRNAEIDRALKAWAQQVAQYALNVTDYAVVQAFDDAGIEWVEWISEKDERVCRECNGMDGSVFLLDELPRKPHPKCRCRIRPAKGPRDD